MNSCRNAWESVLKTPTMIKKPTNALGVQLEASGTHSSRNVKGFVPKDWSMMPKLKNVKLAQKGIFSAQIRQLVCRLIAQTAWSSIRQTITAIPAQIKPSMTQKLNLVFLPFAQDKKFGTPRHYSAKIVLLLRNITVNSRDAKKLSALMSNSSTLSLENASLVLMEPTSFTPTILV